MVVHLTKQKSWKKCLNIEPESTLCCWRCHETVSECLSKPKKIQMIEHYEV